MPRRRNAVRVKWDFINLPNNACRSRSLRRLEEKRPLLEVLSNWIVYVTRVAYEWESRIDLLYSLSYRIRRVYIITNRAAYWDVMYSDRFRATRSTCSVAAITRYTVGNYFPFRRALRSS